MKYEVNITEVLSRTITVEANSEDEAVNIVSDMYKNEQIVLDYSDFNGDTQIEIVYKELDSDLEVES